MNSALEAAGRGPGAGAGGGHGQAKGRASKPLPRYATNTEPAKSPTKPRKKGGGKGGSG